jgi:hypothetical protein
LPGNIHCYGESADADQARDGYRQALALAHQMGMRPLDAQCQLALGTLREKNGAE